MIYNLKISQIDVKSSGRFTSNSGKSSVSRNKPQRSNYDTSSAGVNDFIETISRRGESTVVTSSQIDVDNYIANVI